ncbi:MAG: PH domain-containing protein [Asgard group archaeon]|nr:PH domain-containing protein [Asgard group archaeon]
MSEKIEQFGPDKKYNSKRQFIAFCWFLFLMLINVAIFLGIGIGGDNMRSAIIYLAISGGLVFTFYILFVVYIYYYYQLMNYRIKKTEMVVQRGVIHKIEQVVPYRAVTNVAVFRSLFDRMFGIGTIRLQTAGSGSPYPEESIEGLVNYQEIYDKLMSKIRSVRAMGLTAASIEGEGAIDLEEELKVNLEILQTLKEIKSLLSEER